METNQPQPETCPSCGASLVDLRGAGMNARKMAREGTCFLWANGQYMCAVEQRKRDQRERETWGYLVWG